MDLRDSFPEVAGFRDPVHGFIQVFRHEKRIIDQPEFQRLRRIHQLGLTFYVYHGAELLYGAYPQQNASDSV